MSAGDKAKEGRSRRGPRALLIVLTLALQGLSWWILEGYQVADSVEFVENAQAILRGEEVIDGQGIRSAFFPLLLAPVLLLADLLGGGAELWVFWAMRALQMGLGVLLVLTTCDLARCMAGERAAFAAGLAVAVNPVFLQYSVSPVTDLLASLFIARSTVRLSRGTTLRDGLWGGVLCGLAVMTSYKTIAFAAALFVALFVTDRVRQRGRWLGLLLGLGATAALQIALDRLTYGEWGRSLFLYVGANFGPLLGKLVYTPAGWIQGALPGLATELKELAAWIYSFNDLLAGAAGDQGGTVRGKYPPHWYFTSLGEWVVAPLLALLALGVGTSFRQLSRFSWVPLLSAGLYVALLSTKGWKDHRLLLPTLPTLAATIGAGAAWLVALRPPLSRIAVSLLLLLAALLGAESLLLRNTRKFSGYWEAMAWIREQAAPNEARVASAYHWAVFMREGPELDLTKLPHQLDGWSLLDQDQRRADVYALLDQDWLITHMPVLTHPEHQDLLTFVNRQFAVEAMFWDPDDFEDIGPVLVLRRTRGHPGERRLFEQSHVEDPASIAQAAGLGDPLRMVRPDLEEELWFLGARYEVLPGDDHGWLTAWHWCASEAIQADYQFDYRITTVDERSSYQVNNRPGWGTSPTNGWSRGTLLRESYPVVAAAEPFDWQQPYRPMGGPYRRGDVMPAWLWLAQLTLGPNPEGGEPLVTGLLELADPVTGAPLRGPGEASGRLERAGHRWNGPFVTVSRFFLQVPPDAKEPDDGQPVPTGQRRRGLRALVDG